MKEIKNAVKLDRKIVLYIPATIGPAAVAVALGRGDDKSVESIRSTEVIEVLMPECVKRNPMKDHGDGDPFLNKLNAITEIAGSSFEAGLLVIAETSKNL